MNYLSALNVLRDIRDHRISHEVEFIAPITSCLLAASTINHPECCSRVNFSDASKSYASSNGLDVALLGEYRSPDLSKSGMQGVTYTRLTRLSNNDEVDFCNTVINDLIYEQFVGYDNKVVQSLAKVVGELHDNVASHASGAGFSAAQTYKTGNTKRIEFAIVDAGQGLLKNVRRVEKSIEDEREAIRWCLARGNTSVKQPDFWAQRIPDDVVESPYPKGTEEVVSQNHHLGEGLWLLSQLIEQTNGALWILSGKGEFLFSRQQSEYKIADTDWNGVAIEFEIIVPEESSVGKTNRSNLDRLGKRLGI